MKMGIHFKKIYSFVGGARVAESLYINLVVYFCQDSKLNLFEFGFIFWNLIKRIEFDLKSSTCENGK